MDYLDRRYEKDPNMVSRLIDDEFILVPIHQDVADLQSICTLDGVGARIWELIDGVRRLSDIREAIVAEFEVEPEVAESDLVEFVQQLEAIGGIRRI